MDRVAERAREEAWCLFRDYVDFLTLERAGISVVASVVCRQGILQGYDRQPAEASSRTRKALAQRCCR
jgi:hypothetical protein